MNREPFIKIVNFMILGVGVLVLGWGQMVIDEMC